MLDRCGPDMASIVRTVGDQEYDQIEYFYEVTARRGMLNKGVVQTTENIVSLVW